MPAWKVFPPAALANHDIVCSPAAVQPNAFARPQCKAADAEDIARLKLSGVPTTFIRPNDSTPNGTGR